MTESGAGPGGRPAHLFALPNLLTYARIMAVPLFAAAFLIEDGQARWVTLAIFVIASLTDWLDGYLARAWKLQSAIGRLLDPIADKLIVATALILLVSDGTIGIWSAIAVVIILMREIAVSGLREFLAADDVVIHVSGLAKWKTSTQMLATVVLLIGPALDSMLDLGATATVTGLVLLWLAAVLTLITGYDYFRGGLGHILKADT